MRIDKHATRPRALLLPPIHNRTDMFGSIPPDRWYVCHVAMDMYSPLRGQSRLLRNNTHQFDPSTIANFLARNNVLACVDTHMRALHLDTVTKRLARMFLRQYAQSWIRLALHRNNNCAQ